MAEHELPETSEMPEQAPEQESPAQEQNRPRRVIKPLPATVVGTPAPEQTPETD